MCNPDQESGNIRQPSAAGRYFALNKDVLLKDLDGLFQRCIYDRPDSNVVALVVPHAGYIFSGETVAHAFSALGRDSDFENIFIIGTSHTATFRGASVYTSGDFVTPFGPVSVNRHTGSMLKNSSSLFNNPESYHIPEHSIEVQLPFIQYYFRKPQKIVPVLLGTSDTVEIREIASTLQPWFRPGNLFIISTDFSHYPADTDARRTDFETTEAFISGDQEKFLYTLKSIENIEGLRTRMCGWSSGLVMMELTKNAGNGSFKKIHYSNSGDSEHGSKENVVGYQAIKYSFSANMDARNPEHLNFTDADRDLMFTIVRRTIESEYSGEGKYVPDSGLLNGSLGSKAGAFVTLKLNGQLRGCIGRFPTELPLGITISEMAYSAAFCDYRFEKLDISEYKNVDIEISVISPLKRINDISEIKSGIHGIYIKKGMKSGTMLPQVATERGWTIEEFLGYTSRDKAGIGWDGWREAEIFIYTTVIFIENT
jgi:AmmeMemoRadiSam system protein B/AmmeMemoRadiSam system protein A